MEKIKNKNLLKPFSRNFIDVENIVYDVCAKEISKGQAIIDIMKLIYKSDEKKNN